MHKINPNNIPTETEHASAIGHALRSAGDSEAAYMDHVIVGDDWKANLLYSPDQATHLDIKRYHDPVLGWHIKGNTTHPNMIGGESKIETKVDMGRGGKIGSSETVLKRYDTEGNLVRELYSDNPLIARLADVAMANMVINHAAEHQRNLDLRRKRRRNPLVRLRS